MDITSREAFAVREFCARYGICRDTFYNEIRRGRLRVRKLGKRTLIPKADAQAWAELAPPARTQRVGVIVDADE